MWDSNSRHLAPKCGALPTGLHPDIHFFAMIPRQAVKIKLFLSVVIYVVKGDFVSLSAAGAKLANARVARICVVSPCPVPDTATALPNQARYQCRYTRIFTFLPWYHGGEKIKAFSVCGHLCGQSRCCAAFGNWGKSSKRRCHKALRGFALIYPGYSYGTPKAGALHLDIQFPDIMVRQRRKLHRLNSELYSHRLSAPLSRIKAPPSITARRTGRTGTLSDQ